MALEGGVPVAYAGAFAEFQLTPPAGLRHQDWCRAIDDAGRFLDGHGSTAMDCGWHHADLFGPGGLVWAMRGAAVTAISRTTAFFSDGRTFYRRR